MLCHYQTSYLSKKELGTWTQHCKKVAFELVCCSVQDLDNLRTVRLQRFLFPLLRPEEQIKDVCTQATIWILVHNSLASLKVWQATIKFHFVQH